MRCNLKSCNKHDYSDNIKCKLEIDLGTYNSKECDTEETSVHEELNLNVSHGHTEIFIVLIHLKKFQMLLFLNI